MASHTNGCRSCRRERSQVAYLLWVVTAWICTLGNGSATSAEHRPRAITALDLATISDIGGHSRGAISVSPSGKYVAFQVQTPSIEARDYDLAWYILATNQKGKLWKVDNGGDIILNPDKSWLTNGSRPPVEAQWSPDSKWILYLKKQDGRVQIWRSHIKERFSEQLTRNRADVLSFQISDDGTKMFFTVAIPDGDISRRLQIEGDRGFLYDDRFHASMKRAPFARTCGTNKQGRVIAVSLERACSPPLWVFDFNTSIERKGTPEDLDAFDRHRKNSTLAWMETKAFVLNRKHDDRVIWLENEDPEVFPGWRPPMRLFATTKRDSLRCGAEECHAPTDVFEGVWWRPGRDEIIMQRADGASKSMTGLYSWKLESRDVRRLLLTEDKLSDCEILESHAICLREQWTHPRTIVSIDLESGDIETIYDPNPAFSKIEFSKIEKIEWKDKFGNPVHGHLVYPLQYEKARRYPLVLTTYISRGFLRGGVGDEYPIHVLAANGFMVLSFNTPNSYRRDAIARSREQAQWDDLYDPRSALSAQEIIVDILNSRGLTDPERIAITGLSAGAMQVIFALIHSDIFATGIVSSAFDWRSGYYSSNQQWRLYRRHMFGGVPYDDKTGIFQALSLGLNAKNIDAPLLINVSDSELQNSTESFVRLQDANRPVEMHVFPGEYHIKWQPQHRLSIYSRNIQWLKFWLLGEEERPPVDIRQYKRWRELLSLQNDID